MTGPTDTVLDQAAEPQTSPLVSTTGAGLLAGAWWKGLGFLLPQVNTMVLSVVAARYLGPSGMGEQSYIAFVSLSVATLATGGVPMTILRYVSLELGAGRPEAVRGVIRWGWRVAGVAALLGGAVVAAPALTGSSYRAAWLLAAGVTAVGILNGIPWAILSALQRWRLASLWSLATGTAAVGATVGVLASGHGITAMFAVEAVVGLVSVAGSTLFCVRHTRAVVGKPIGGVSPSGREMLHYTAMTTVQLLVTYLVFRRTELFFLKHYSTNSQIALYSIAFAVIAAAQQVPGVIHELLEPVLANLWGAGQVERIRNGISRALRICLIVCLTLASGLAAVGPALLSALYGHRYDAVGPVLLLGTLTLAIVPVCSIGSPLMRARAQLRLPVVAVAIGAVVDAAAALLLVPHLGARGAAIANLLAQTVAMAPVLWAARRFTGPMGVDRAFLLRTVLVAATTGAAGYGGTLLVSGVGGVVLGVAAGGGAFYAVGRLVGVLSPSDAQWLLDAGGARSTRLLSWTARTFSHGY